MNFKWTDEKIEEYVKQETDGYILRKIVKGIKGDKTRIFLTCNHGHDYDVNFDNFQKGKRCPKCNGTIKYNYDEIKKYIEIESKSGCLLKSTAYNNIDYKLELECFCGQLFYVSFYSFKFNKKCKCNDCVKESLSKRFRHPIEYIREQILILSNGECKLKSKVYINGKLPINIQCNCGNIYTVTYFDFIHNEQYCCPECSKHNSSIKRSTPYKEAKLEYEKFEYVLCEGYVNASTPSKVICSSGHESYMILTNFRKGERCRKCFYESISGENHYAWKGGISPIYEHFRGILADWKNKSMFSSNYKCVVTGENFDVIHHLYSFNKIVNEIFKISQIQLKPIMSYYSQDELNILDSLCIKLHNKYGNGVCLQNCIHKHYHKLYSDDNTKEQFEEYLIRLKSGEFNDFLKENNLSLMI